MSEDLTIARWAPLGMLTIRADLGTLGEAIGAAVPFQVPATLRVTESDDGTCAWFSPDELLLVCPPEHLAQHQSALHAALESTHHLLADVSDMRVGFSLRGPRVREVLSKLVPIDLHADTFGPGQVRRTQLGQVAAALWMPTEDRAEVLCFRSVARYVETALTKAADPRAAIADYGK